MECGLSIRKPTTLTNAPGVIIGLRTTNFPHVWKPVRPARVFGRLDDSNSELSKRLASVRTQVLKEQLGTHPNVHYTALSGDVI
jgi:hypothetical protein